MNDTITIEQAKQLVMADIEAHAEWREEVGRGKMFGVLIVRPPKSPVEGGCLLTALDDGRYFLKAYSGQILGRSDWEGYVPAIFDYLQEDGYFKRHEAEITAINNKVREEQAKLPPGKRTRQLEELKAERKERSNALQRWLFSQFMIAGASYPSEPSTPSESINPSNPSTSGTLRPILDVFQDYAKANNLKQQLPPGGTGECCAPKLLHYANTHGLRPLELMEFWYGDSPVGEIRHHGQCYEPCQAKCQPILWHMIPKDDFVIHAFDGHSNRGSLLSLSKPVPKTITQSDIIYEDDYLIAINKPAGLLSVPGKRHLPNAEDMLKELMSIPPLFRQGGSDPLCRNSGGIRYVHRLDMDTSGVLLAAKTEEVYVLMQRMFAEHQNVRKEYIAITSPNPSEGELLNGVISLPLSPDFLNRPRQRVDYENGKEAITRYEVIGRTADGSVRLRLIPLTGRTHQLRVHCAHKDGLGMPIVGDPLYGNVSADRMYLHAETLIFRHPVTGEDITIRCEADF